MPVWREVKYGHETIYTARIAVTATLLPPFPLLPLIVFNPSKSLI